MLYGKELLISNIENVHTTSMGVNRVIKNLKLSQNTDVVDLCKQAIMDEKSSIRRNGKNWYITNSGNVFTVNATSYTLITAHPNKG